MTARDVMATAGVVLLLAGCSGGGGRAGADGERGGGGAATPEAVTTFSTNLPDTEPPTAPTGLTATAVSAHEVTLTWAAASDGEGGGVTGYRVFRNGDPVAMTSGVTSLTDVELTAGTTYTYTVTACDAAGNCSAQTVSTQVTTQTAPTPAAPTSAPTGFVAVAGTGQITLTWNPNPASETVTGYTLSMGQASWETWSSPPPGAMVHRDLACCTFTHPGLTNGTTYYFALAAGTGTDEGPQSAQVSATPRDLAPPAVPSGVTATVVSSQATLTWSASVDDVGVTGYTVFRDGAPRDTVTDTTYSDTGLSASTRYVYTVAACDAAGNCSEQSAPTEAITPAASPSAPTGLAATPAGQQVTLTWNPNPAGESVTSYTLSMALTSWQIWTTTLPGAMQHSGLACCTFLHTDLTSEQTYYFALAAADADEGPQSAQVSATPHVSPTPTRAWLRQLDTSGEEFAFGLAVDGAGNIYVAGRTTGAFDGNSSAGFVDAFLIKYDPGGATQWIRQFGTPGYEYARAVAVDRDDNIYVAGETSDALDGNPSAGGYDFFVVKFDPAGARQWTRQVGTAMDESATGLAVDGAGNIYVIGTTSGDLAGSPNAGARDLFLVKFDAAGATQWIRQEGTPQNDKMTGVALDRSGNIYLTGSTGGQMSGQQAQGQGDMVFMKYDPDGARQWIRQEGTPEGDWSYAAAVDALGSFYAAGHTQGRLDGNPNAGVTDLLVIKYDGAGTKQWSRQRGTPGVDATDAAAVDASGNLYMTGHTVGALDGNPSAGDGDVFIVKHDPTGAWQWTIQFGSPFSDEGRAVAADGAGNIYVTGFTNGSLDGNPAPAGRDIFLVKYTP